MSILHDELYQCQVCSHFVNKVVLGKKDKVKLGAYFYGTCPKGCVYPDNVECIRSRKSLLRRVK